MKREIKFRAWDNVHQCFDENVAANLLMQLHDPYEEVDEKYGERFFLSQYTGLKDKIEIIGNIFENPELLK